MVTRRRTTKPPQVIRPGHLFIEEHIEAKNSSFEEIGKRMGVSRTTVWRWANEQWRLDPGKIAALAKAIGLDSWQDLGTEPGKISVDGMLVDADPNVYEAVVDLARKLTKKPH